MNRRTRPAGRPAVRIDPDNEWAWCGERRLALTPRAFAVLRHLVEHPARLITKDDLLATVWRDAIVSEAALASCIRDLRKALGDSSDAPRYIETVHRRGFRFIGPIASTTAASSSTTVATGPEVGPHTGPPASAEPGNGAPALVGREVELGILHDRLRRAMNGRRQLVFVTGEPGLGKTALVEGFLAQITDSTLRVGRGQCVEQYGPGEPYLPVLEALGRLGRAPGAEPLVRILQQYAPTWLAQLPGLLTDSDVDAVQRRAQGATRDRMLRELVEALDTLTVDAPLVLVLEDLHWSDSATIDLLGMLARRRDVARLLVLGTYRPADIAAAPHPLRAVKQELQLHGHCEEMPLQFLTVAAVGEYLSRRFPDHAFSPDLALLLHRNTDGNPLFLVNTIDFLIAHGRLRDRDGRWHLSGPVDTIALGAPDTLWEMVHKHVERLTPDEQAILAVASVAGAEFSSAISVAAGIDAKDGERRCEALARRAQFLRATGVAEWPDGTVAGRYAFIHALYQQVFHARIPAGYRVGLHRRTGQRLEQAFGDRAPQIAGELAMHFEHGRDFERATRYHMLAGHHALGQHAYREAAGHATRALELIASLPDSPARIEGELALQAVLGAALSATMGYATPEVARAYARARELCVHAGGTAQLFPILLGLGRFYLVRAEFETARGVGLDLLTLAEATREPAHRLAAHNALGVVSFYAGDLEAALDHLERGLELYDPARHSPDRSPAFQLGQDPGVSCATHAAMTLWMLGYPARATARIEEALQFARAGGHPFSLSYACHFAAGVYQWLGEREIVRELEAAALVVDTEHGFELFRAAGAIQGGWLLAQDGDGARGLVQMRESLARLRAIGAEVLVPAYLCLVAEVCAGLGRPAEARAAVAEALTAIRQSGPHYWQADLHRLDGLLMLDAEDTPDPDADAREEGAGGSTRARETPPEGPTAGGTGLTYAGARAASAEARLLDAIGVARRQRAKSLELRAATALSRLRARQGKPREAHALLSEVYEWFTEGFGTVDLRDARHVLEELERRAGADP